MENTAELEDSPLTLCDIDAIKTDMAYGKIDIFQHQFDTQGSVTQDISVQEAWDLHSDVFNKHGISKDAWYLIRHLFYK